MPPRRSTRARKPKTPAGADTSIDAPPTTTRASRRSAAKKERADDDGLSKLTLKALRPMAKELGISPSGTKDQVIWAIRDARAAIERGEDPSEKKSSKKSSKKKSNSTRGSTKRSSSAKALSETSGRKRKRATASSAADEGDYETEDGGEDDEAAAGVSSTSRPRKRARREKTVIDLYEDEESAFIVELIDTAGSPRFAIPHKLVDKYPESLLGMLGNPDLGMQPGNKTADGEAIELGTIKSKLHFEAFLRGFEDIEKSFECFSTLTKIKSFMASLQYLMVTELYDTGVALLEKKATEYPFLSKQNPLKVKTPLKELFIADDVTASWMAFMRHVDMFVDKVMHSGGHYSVKELPITSDNFSLDYLDREQAKKLGFQLTDTDALLEAVLAGDLKYNGPSTKTFVPLASKYVTWCKRFVDKQHEFGNRASEKSVKLMRFSSVDQTVKWIINQLNNNRASGTVNSLPSLDLDYVQKSAYLYGGGHYTSSINLTTTTRRYAAVAAREEAAARYRSFKRNRRYGRW